jgi:dGTPase
VHPLSKNDHVHNRLTHSLEVASLGRSLGLGAGDILQEKFKNELKIDPYDIAYIIQTACLAHDIGNPPFGHAGEEVIKEWFKKHKHEEYLKKLKEEELNDFINFDGNAQSFRIVSVIENNLFKGGMNLTCAILGTLVKYPYSSAKCDEFKKSKFNYFQSEKTLFDSLFDELGLKIDENHFKRHPLSFLMEAADDICYGLLDLQDAIELQIITLNEIEDIFDSLCAKEKKEQIYSRNEFSDSQKVSYLVAVAMNNLAKYTLEVFKNNFDKVCSNNQPKDLIELFEKDELKDGLKKAKELGREKIFNEIRKVELELGAYNIIQTLLGHLIKAAYSLNCHKDINKLSFRVRRALTLMGSMRPKDGESLYHMYQRVLDYIVGMTDDFAKHTAHQLIGMGY